jgi:hypothetical protein
VRGVRTEIELRQAALPLAGGQVLPASVELIGLTMFLSPVAMASTVTE